MADTVEKLRIAVTRKFVGIFRLPGALATDQLCRSEERQAGFLCDFCYPLIHTARNAARIANKISVLFKTVFFNTIDPQETVNFKASMRYFTIVLLLCPLTASADRFLLADCAIRPDDSYLERGTHFVIAFNIEASIETIWILKDGELDLYGSDGPETPFEVNGGVWSMTLASDVRKSLRRMDFRFAEGAFPPSAEELTDTPELCDFDYSQIAEYDSGEWALSTVPAKAAETYHGTFVHYEDAEYESTFIPCGPEEVWRILDGPSQTLLIARAMATESREILVSLVLQVTPSDKSKYLQSHYSGTAQVVRIIDSEEAQRPCEGR